MHLELLRIFAWPMAIVVLGLGSLVIFWKPIARKIGEATELRLRNHLFMRAGLRGSETEPEEEVDQADTAAAPRQAQSRLPAGELPHRPEYNRADKRGHLYWLGHDLMWTIAVAAAEGGMDKIEHGLRQSLHHARELQLPQSITQVLEASCRDVRSASGMDKERVEKLISQLVDVKAQIGKLLESQQEGFRPRPG